MQTTQAGRVTRRSLVACCILLFVLLLGIGSVSAGERYAVIVSGVSGGEKYAAQQRKWRDDLAASLRNNFVFAEANVVTLAEESVDTSKATAENVRRLFGDLRKRLTREDLLLVVLLGHGTFDGEAAKFNLVGPDLTAVEWKGLFDEVPGRLVVVNTTESSYPFLEELSGRGRVIITATDSVAQRFATVFPEYFVRAISDLSSDFDKNGRVSVWEAFAAASAAVKQHYEQRGQLSTERPVLDDNGDRVGREAQAPGPDGTLARTTYFDAEPGTITADVALAGLQRRRAALEAQLEELKGKKESLATEDYEAQLERILVEFARVARQIRQRS
ncbi:MAG: hypothetical protein ACRD26_22645 [Vicinamibacterales bacterium]